ncbi:hypothetical protein [Mucilaginibacter sp. SP1R1]|uniref:hypothetical protein n=1 Tax=Mucilaginibacter sp. SP1R1 TaxID=2723091 RepID=UPI001609855C|nr:hypothetical protein [Mucilaginibacter sp. SP1R1]MBB6149736.1 hypothetical protein [Mucilaginibacter sp. SP1R1]
MTPIKSISIPTPCHESWQQMTPVEHGRHCRQCCKTVTDFTVMSNQQIISHLSNQKNVCGRFGEQQLHSINHELYIENLSAPNGWKKWVMAIGILSSTLFFKAQAQTKPIKVVQTHNKPGKPVRDTTIVGDTVILGKVASPVCTDKKIDFQPNITEQYTCVEYALVGAVSVSRPPFFKRLYNKFIKQPVHYLFN